MRTANFRNLLTDVEAAPVQVPVTADDELFITYNQLPVYGVPKYSRVHIRRLIVSGLFPRPVMLSPNRIAWRMSDLASWKASRPNAPLPVEARTCPGVQPNSDETPA